MPDEKPKPKKREKLPINYMANEFMDQQLTTLNKKEKKNANDANGNGSSTREHLEGDSEEPENPDSKLRKESAVSKGPAEGS